MKSGVVIINKEEGITSQGAVNRLKRLLGHTKAGHTGTLDPLATGVLPILVGRAVKASEFLLTADKHYSATLLLGCETDTEDVTGEVLSKSDDIPEESAVMAAIASMVGDSMQTPPMYSALKVGGKKLCDLAREGKSIEREARPITVFDIKAKKLSNKEYLLDIKCSKGTYIRTLCADIGKRLGCGGAMASLMRSKTCGFSIEQSHTLASLEEMTLEQRLSLLIPVEELFSDLPAVTLPEFFEKLCRGGCEIYQKKIGTSVAVGTRVRLYGKEGFFALGEVRDYENGSAIKSIKIFAL